METETCRLQRPRHRHHHRNDGPRDGRRRRRTTTTMTVVGPTSDLSGDEPPTHPGTMAATGESDDPLA